LSVRFSCRRRPSRLRNRGHRATPRRRQVPRHHNQLRRSIRGWWCGGPVRLLVGGQIPRAVGGDFFYAPTFRVFPFLPRGARRGNFPDFLPICDAYAGATRRGTFPLCLFADWEGHFSAAGRRPTEWFPASLARARSSLFSPRESRPGRCRNLFDERNLSVMPTEREPCAFCGDQHWTSTHYTAGRLVCQLCWQGRAPAVAMPATGKGKRQLELWCAPRVPPRQQTPRLGPVSQPGGPCHGG
jgi:hypothetical protein